MKSNNNTNKTTIIIIIIILVKACLPDEDSRIFSTVGEYISFINSPGYYYYCYYMFSI